MRLTGFPFDEHHPTFEYVICCYILILSMFFNDINFVTRSEIVVRFRVVSRQGTYSSKSSLFLVV